jgi:protein TonB
MSYTDERKGFSPASIGTVVAVHAAIGYAFISGLAYQVIQTVPLVTMARNIPADEAPPPNQPPPPQTKQRTETPPVQTDRVVDVPLNVIPSLQVETVPVRPTFDTVVTPPPPERATPQAQPSMIRGAVPVGSRASWVTAEDYPAAALRAEVEGTVGIDVAIDARGRVTDCIVTASSGSDVLDQTTCRLYARRARFTPALDEAGRPAATHRADRVRWQIPR